MNNQKDIAKDSLKLTSVKMVTLIVGMITVIILSRQRSLTEYGTYSQIKMIVNLFTAIFTAGLTSSINYFIGRSENQEQIRSFTKTYFTLITALSFVCGLMLVLIVPVLTKTFENVLLENYLYVFFLLPWINMISGSLDNYLIAQRKVKHLIIYKIVDSFLILALAVVTGLLNWDLSKYLISLMICDTLLMAIIYILVAKISNSRIFGLDYSLVMPIFKFSIPIGLANIVGTLSIEIDKILIGLVTDTEQFAIYENMSRELPFAIITSSITAVLMPQIVKMIKEKRNKDVIITWSNSVNLTFIVMCFATTMLIIFAPQVVSLLYSDKYLSGVPIFQVYSCILLLRITYFGIILNSTGHTKFIFHSSIISLVINAVLNVILYFVLGIIGPAIATILSIAIVGGVQLFVSCKLLDCSMKQVFPWKSMGKILLINVGVGILGFIGNFATSRFIGVNDILLAVLWGIFCISIYVLIVRKKIVNLWNSLNK